MILYRLVCEGEHEFESWFRDSAAYEDQRVRGLVTCPACGADKVEKAIMAPRLARSRGAEPTPPEDAAPAAAPAVPAGEGAPAVLLSEREQALRGLLRAMREHVVKNADYVGGDFASLTRQMHEGDVEKRSIYGEASPDEVRALIEDEIEVHPLPNLPDERN
ncbi:DUF1178 family protein [Ancylobacter sp. 6x-1]|uniref:DUF1178 family protein n=1 Tax=Ancylobacter crimeensis TaxID=2579147 RepID=A0ABT0DES6_9HYPH|nr:DUF1178 family protein [Ancylobacter crimeensis]MCK0198455.1 DUF1178 family protein [Ancylobacter crimeensis]